MKKDEEPSETNHEQANIEEDTLNVYATTKTSWSQ